MNYYNIMKQKITETKTRTISKKFSTKEQNLKRRKYSHKKVHSYFYNKLQSNIKIDTNISNRCSTDKSMTSQFEGYLALIHDQEIPTKYLKTNYKRKLVKKQHAILNVDYVNTVPKMLTISSAPAQKYPLGIIYQLDTT